MVLVSWESERDKLAWVFILERGYKLGKKRKISLNS